MKRLSPKQLKFCHEYLKSGNGTQSYKISHGIKDDEAAKACSSRLLTNATIQLYIKQRQQKTVTATDITLERVAMELGKIAFGSIDESVEIDDSGAPRLKQDADLSSIDGISGSESNGADSCSRSFSIKRSDKVKALDQLSKLLGFYERGRSDTGRNVSLNATRVLEALRKLRGNK